MRSAAKRASRWRRWRPYVLAATALLALAPVSVATYDTELPEAESFDAAIVLGAAIYRDKPSPVFAARLDYARDLLRAKRASFVIVTGGVGEGEKLSEAEVGRNHLVAHGVDARSVLVEMTSRTTFENLCNAAQVAKPFGFQRFAVVSDPLHLRRALLLASDAGLSAIPAGTPYTRYRSIDTRLTFLLRESYFVARRLVTGRQECVAGQSFGAIALL